MRDLPAAFAAHLSGGVTTLCRCWTLRRCDGVALGFTDHDRDLTVGGVLHEARSGLEAAEASAESGFAVSGGDVAGALSALSLTEADILGGLYDGAGIETWLVDWSDPATRLLLDLGTIGEVRREGDAFVAEVRGLAARLDVPMGRSYRATCDADFGDRRCRVDPGPWQATGRVLGQPEDATLSVSLASTVAEGLFSGGRLLWTGGANTGAAADVRLQMGDLLELWERPARPVAVGDTFTVTAGCDCAATWSSPANFPADASNPDVGWPAMRTIVSPQASVLQDVALPLPPRCEASLLGVIEVASPTTESRIEGWASYYSSPRQ